MDYSKYLYILPLLLGFVFFILFLFKSNAKYRLQSFGKRSRSRIIRGVQWAVSTAVPRDSRIYIFYRNHVLKYSQTTVEKLLYIKVAVFAVTLIMIALIKATNISIETSEIFSHFEYKMDLIYRYKDDKLDTTKALNQEIYCLNTALKEISAYMLKQESPETIQLRIKNLLHHSDIDLLLPEETLVNKVYHRLVQYYKVRKLNLPAYLLIAFILSFAPELFFYIRNVFVMADARRELSFLKRLVILNGSIKPVDFMEVLGILIDKSKYYRTVLEEIEDKNKRNSVDNTKLYSHYIKNCKYIDLKLFFEKLDEANNYDFDQAIHNIENEFRLQRREEGRRIRKRIELIHIIGIMGFMLIIALLIAYLIVPWMQMYDIHDVVAWG